MSASLALALLNLRTLGGLDALHIVLGDRAPAPIKAIQILYGWLPRAAVCLLAGAGLAAAGTAMQQVLRNSIAAPMTLGVAAGAQLALSIATLAAPWLLADLSELAAMLGGGLALALVIALSWRRNLDPTTVLLAGLVVSLYVGAVNAGLLLIFDYDLRGLWIWGSGVLTQHDWSEAAFLLPRVAIGLTVLALLARPLTVMTLDDAGAQALGLDLKRARLLSLAVAVYLTACVVSAVGVIAFIGLAAPTLARLLGARTLIQRLAWAPPLGGTLLLLFDQLVQTLDPYVPGLLPTGTLTALVGAPLLLWLLLGLRSGIPAAARGAFAARVRPASPRLAAIGLAALAAVCMAAMVARGPDGWHLDAPLTIAELTPWRWPRVLSAACAGLLLGVAGTLLQRLLRNPMASPETLGISGGALVGVVAAIFLASTAPSSLLLLAGTAGALVVAGGLLVFAQRTDYAPERILLAGIALKALFDGIMGLVAVSGTPFWLRLLNWISGSTYGADWSTLAGMAAVAGLVLPAGLLMHRDTDLLALGEDQAAARGLDVPRVRLALLLVAALATTAATLLVGPLSFIGLMAPHLATMLGLRRSGSQLLGACGLGLTLMVLADWTGRTVLVPYEIPAGLAAALLGGLYFMWLVRRL